MVDATPEQIVTILKDLKPEELAKAFKVFNDEIDNGFIALGNLTQASRGATIQNGALKQSLKGVNDETKSLIDNDAPSYFDNMAYSTTEAQKSLIGLGGEVLLLTALINRLPAPTLFSDINKGAVESSANLSDMTQNLAGLLGVKVGGDGAGQILAYVDKLAKLSDSAKNSENNLLGLAASSGELGDLLKASGDDLSNLSLKMERMSSSALDLANASGISQKQASHLIGELMKIPGAMDAEVKMTDSGTESLHLLDAALKVSQGTGQSFSDVVKQMTVSFENFGEVGKKPLEMVSKISEVSQNLKMPLDLVKEYTLNAGNAFKMLGDNTQGALRILDQFGPGLKASGLGAKSVVEVVGQMTDGIKGMGIAQKAFLSSQTGGPGGLQGAFKIESLMQQGKVDEVLKMSMANLKKQFGGKILSMDDATKSQGGAADYYRQVKMVQSPAMGGLAKDDASAYKILDVMKKMQEGSLEQGGKNPEEAFKAALQTGDKLQQRQFNELTKISNDTERAADLQAITAYSLTRNLLGSGTVARGAKIGEGRKEASQELAPTQLIKGMGTQSGKSVDEVMNDFAQSLPDKLAAGKINVKEFFLHMEGMISGQVPGSAGYVNDKMRPPASAYDGVKTKNNESKLVYPKQNVNVNVQTVCMQCQKIVAKSEALAAIDTRMNANETADHLHNHLGIK